MTDGLFREGGPNKIRHIGEDTYEMSVTIPTDERDFIGRKCPQEACTPAYFKIRLGTGLPDTQGKVFCPYCRTPGGSQEFMTEEQVDYGKRVLVQEAASGVERMLGNALGLGPSRKRKLAGGLINVEISLQSTSRGTIGRPLEEELRREIVCPACTLVHAVYGLAIWCPDCSADIFGAHIEAECEVLRKILGTIDERHAALGARVAARDIDNALEDVVSLLEAALKFMMKRALIDRGRAREEAEEILERKVRNGLQSLTRAHELFEEYLDIRVREAPHEAECDKLSEICEKRHPITHNLGVIDAKYLRKAAVGAVPGEEIRVTAEEVSGAVDLAEALLIRLWGKLFPA